MQIKAYEEYIAHMRAEVEWHRKQTAPIVEFESSGEEALYRPPLYEVPRALNPEDTEDDLDYMQKSGIIDQSLRETLVRAGFKQTDLVSE